MSLNPFLTIYGPRPAAWWAVCNLCSQTSRPRFDSVEAAGEWEHDCHHSEERDEMVVTVTLTADDAPKIRFNGSLTGHLFREMRDALSDMNRWQESTRYRSLADGQLSTWEDAVHDGWQKRRHQENARVVAEFERSIEHPYVCPGGCGQRCKTVGGLKNHMRACWKIDPFKFKRGEYDDAMIPGGAA